VQLPLCCRQDGILLPIWNFPRALAAAKTKSGLSYTQIAQRIGLSEQRVIDICTGAQRPTTTEFNALAQALGVQDRNKQRRDVPPIP